MGCLVKNNTFLLKYKRYLLGEKINIIIIINISLILIFKYVPIYTRELKLKRLNNKTFFIYVVFI